MFDLSLLTSPLMLLLCISNVFGFLALYVPYIYLPKMMVLEGIAVNKASLVISVIGIANTVGRILVGWLVDHPKLSSLVVTNCSLICSGMCLIGFPFCHSLAAFVVLATLLGLCLSAYISLTSVVVVDLLGLDMLTSAFGLIVAFRGISSILGPPMAGMLFELTGHFSISFYIAGLFFFLAGASGQIAFFIHKRNM